MTPGLRLTVLVDNNTLTDRYFTGEPGLSFLIETAGKKILFDTGYSGVFLANAGKMGIDLRDLDHVVLSHGHLDHTGGLVMLVRLLTEATIEDIPYRVPELIAHPFCFCPREKIPLQNIGSILDESEIRRQFPVNLSRQPVWITDDLVFLGEIPGGFRSSRPGRERGGYASPMAGPNPTSCSTIRLLSSAPVRVLSSSPAARMPGSALSPNMPGRSAANNGSLQLSADFIFSPRHHPGSQRRENTCSP